MSTTVKRKSLLDGIVQKKTAAYTDTIDLAMERLASIEQSICKALEVKPQVKARELERLRHTIRHGYTGNTDSTGWVWSVPMGSNYTLRRVSIYSDATGPFGVFVGSTDASGLREIANVTLAVVFPNGVAGYAYSDSFDNDVYVQSGQTIYILPLVATPYTHTVIVSMEVDESVPVKRDVTESEVYAMESELVETVRDSVDGLETSDPASRVDVSLHFAPDTEEELETDTLDAREAATEHNHSVLPDPWSHMPNNEGV